MAVDYLSTLNSKGSGLNITQLVDSIVAAEIEPAKALINDKSSANDLSISEMAKFKSRVGGLQSALGVVDGARLYALSSSSAAVGIAAQPGAAISTGSTQINVNRLATSQVLEFSGFSSVDAAIPTGTLTVDIGAWATGGVFTADTGKAAQTVTIGSSNATLSGLATALSALSGVDARVVSKGDGTYSLSVVSETGAQSALRLTASSGGPTAFDTTDASNQITAAADAEFELNGILLNRSTNVISDIVTGANVTLRAVTSSAETLAMAKDKDGAKAQLQALIDQLNDIRGYLATATARGLNGAESGALAGDAAIAAIKQDLDTITTSPLKGFAGGEVYLAEIGVKTNRDGSLSLDAAKLEEALESAPEKFQAVFESANSVAAGHMSLGLSSSAKPPVGAHDFVYDAGTDSATLNGVSLSSRTNSEGQREFYKLTGDFSGTTLKITSGAPSNTTVYIGQSLVDRLSKYLDKINGTGGEIVKKETSLNEKSKGYKAEITKLDDQAMVLEARHFKRFAAMEKMVTQLKSTGDYITTMMDAWNKKD
jgi:flagellar hook-associated protein 2